MIHSHFSFLCFSSFMIDRKFKRNIYSTVKQSVVCFSEQFCHCFYNTFSQVEKEKYFYYTVFKNFLISFLLLDPEYIIYITFCILHLFFLTFTIKTLKKQKQPPEVFCTKRCSEKFRKFRRKPAVLESLPACNFVKKRLQHKRFSVKFAKSLQNITEHVTEHLRTNASKEKFPRGNIKVSELRYKQCVVTPNISTGQNLLKKIMRIVKY